MKYVVLPEDKPRRLSFYLAMEEYIARHLKEPECFFMWQVEPSVIFGRNQLIENEVNLAYCKEHGIQMFRRKSGGGCVYADRSNVMFSYITSAENVAFTFSKYMGRVVFMLQRLGLEAAANGRNDVMIGDRKVSGNAFYHLPGRCVVHGTMLYDTNMAHMVGSITPTDEKLLSKGVQSVRQRVALLKDYLDMTLEEFKAYVRQTMCKEDICLSAEDVGRIEELEKEYLSDSFVYGCNPKYTIVRKQRIEGVGEMEVRMAIKNGLIVESNMMGDYFLVGEQDTLLGRLRGVPLERNALQEALPDPLHDMILNLKKTDFINLLLNEKPDHARKTENE